MTFHIEPAAIADIPAMHAVRLAVRENRLTDRARITEQSYVPYVEAGSSWVATTPSQGVVGFVIADQEDARIWALFVHPDHEGTGIGKALHEALLTWARRRGLGTLWLTTAPGTRAEKFYLRQGWERTGVVPAGDIRFERAASG